MSSIKLNVKNSNIINTAKAWVNFNGIPLTPSIRDSYNISSITRLSTGRYRINFSNSLTNSNYSLMGIGQGPYSAAGPGDFKISVLADQDPPSNNMTDLFVDIETGYNSENIPLDANMASIIIFNNM